MLPTGDSGNHPARQRAHSMRSTYHRDNADDRMTAMRNRNSWRVVWIRSASAARLRILAVMRSSALSRWYVLRILWARYSTP